MRSENVYAVNWIKGVKMSTLPRMSCQMWVVSCFTGPGPGPVGTKIFSAAAWLGLPWLGLALLWLFDSAEGCDLRRALHLFHAPLHCEMCQIKRSKPQGWPEKAWREERERDREEEQQELKERAGLTHMPDRPVLANFAPCLLFALRVVFIQLRVENFVISFSVFK